MKKTIALLLMAALALSAIACSSPASTGGKDTSLEDVKASGKLVHGMDDAFPPMGFRDATTNELIGFDVDVAMEVAKRMGVELVPTPIDWSQKINELDTGNIDVIWNGFTITEDRIEQTEMTFPYMTNRQIIVVLDSSPYYTLSDLAGKKLALQLDSSAEEALESSADFKASLAGGEAIKFTANDQALMDLEIGGSDCVLIDEIVANYYISLGHNYRVLEESLADEDYGIGCQKGSVALKNEIERILKEMKADGSLAEISTKWFSKDVTTVP